MESALLKFERLIRERTGKLGQEGQNTQITKSKSPTVIDRLGVGRNLLIALNGVPKLLEMDEARQTPVNLLN